MLRTILTALVAATITLCSPAFASEPTFEDFPAIDVPVHDLKQPVLMHGDDFWDYRTTIRDRAKQNGVNFDGAFTLLEWGCEVPCQMGVLIDRTDGHVYGYLPTATTGYSFRADSKLLIVNPDLSDYAENGGIPEWLHREFWVFHSGLFTLIYQDRGEQSGNVLSDPACVAGDCPNSDEQLNVAHPLFPDQLKMLEDATPSPVLPQ